MSKHPGIELLKSSITFDWFSGNTFGNDLTPFADHPIEPLQWDSMEEYRFVYDKHAAYLSAASMVYMGAGPILHSTDTRYFGEHYLWDRQPGIRHIELGVPYSGGTPPMEFIERFVSRETWQYLPMVEFLAKYYPIMIRESYTFTRRHQSLKQFYRLIKDMLDSIDRLAEATGTDREDQTIAVFGFPENVSRETLKRLYVTTFGLLNRPPEYPIPGYVYQPDWWYSLVSQCNATMLYHVMQAWEQDSVLPLKVSTDALYYDKLVHLPVGETIGKFHMEQEQRSNAALTSWDNYYDYNEYGEEEE